MKRLGLFVITVLLSLGACFSSFAGEWRQDQRGWWYANGDSTYANNGWEWIDGRCYYFTSQGYCLQETTTPDGYQVDSSGAWIVNGVVQIQEGWEPASAAQPDNVYPMGALQFTLPAGYMLYEQSAESLIFVNLGANVIIGVSSQYMGEGTAAITEYFGEYMNDLLDQAIISSFGQFDSKSQQSFPTGAWRRYDYASVPSDPEIGSAVIYARITGDDLQIVVLMGNMQNVDADGVMNNHLR